MNSITQFSKHLMMSTSIHGDAMKVQQRIEDFSLKTRYITINIIVLLKKMTNHKDKVINGP